MARKGRARRFREARQLKQRDDGLFQESENRSLADAEDSAGTDDDEFDDDFDDVDDDEYDPLDH